MTKYYTIQAGRIVVTDKSEAKIAFLVNPAQEEISDLIKDYEIDDHTAFSISDSDELARLEYEDDHIAIVYKRPKNYSATDYFQFRVSSVGVFLFKDFVIVVSDSELPITNEKKFNKLTSLKMFVLKLLNLSVFHFNEHLRIINKMSNELEAKHLSDLDKKEYLAIFGLSKSLVYYTNAVSSNETMLKKLQMSRSLKFDENEQDLLEEIIIENSQCKRLTEIYSSILSSMMVSHEVSNEGNTSDDINALKVLTVLTIVIMIPTAVASLFSMNVTYPFNVESPLTFWIIFILMMSGTFSFWLWLNKKKM
ncbi:MAG: magnesium transporter CorA family protein [Fibromonadaceae bacterium]|nr:magnesium transporter CorA family protein [Fibromonadaceae bacterium]